MNKKTKNQRQSGGDGLPFPDSDLTPTLQREIKRKIEAGEIDEVDEDLFFGLLGCTSVPEKDDKK